MFGGFLFIFLEKYIILLQTKFIHLENISYTKNISLYQDNNQTSPTLIIKVGLGLSLIQL